MRFLGALLLVLLSGPAAATGPEQAIAEWGLEAIRASHRQHADPASLPAASRHPADPRQRLLVIETGDHHIMLLDGERLEPIHRFPTRPLHGSPKYSPDGRFVYFAARDGWVSKYDLHTQTPVAEVRVGLETRNLAVSADGRYLMIANAQPQTLVLMDAESMLPIKLYLGKSLHGAPSGFSAVYTVPPRETFIVALMAIPEIWEISYADQPPPGFSGWVHDFNPESGDEVTHPFPLRRLQTRGRLDDFGFDPDHEHLIGTSPEAGSQVLYLYIGRRIATLNLPGQPRTGAGMPFCHQGQPVMAIPNSERGLVSLVNMQTWTIHKHIATLGPGAYVRTHAASPHLWVAGLSGPHADTVQIIDKRSLEIVATLQPSPGKPIGTVEFTDNGQYVLASIMGTEGALIIYDARTLKEIKRRPMRNPNGIYPVPPIATAPTTNATICSATTGGTARAAALP